MSMLQEHFSEAIKLLEEDCFMKQVTKQVSDVQQRFQHRITSQMLIHDVVTTISMRKKLHLRMPSA